MPIKLYISKPIDEVENLRMFCEHRGWQLIAHSFLAFEPKPFVWDGEEEIVFFSSPRAVDFFHAQHRLPKEKIYACAGKKTQEKLLEYGIRAGFVADRSGKVAEMSKAFAAFANGKRVIFPVSNLSKRSYSQHLPNRIFRFVQVYQTHITSAEIKDCDLYVFTSPSNVKGFLIKNPVTLKPTISWGETTSQSLHNHGFKVFKQLDISSIEALIEVLSALNDHEIKGYLSLDP